MTHLSFVRSGSLGAILFLLALAVPTSPLAAAVAPTLVATWGSYGSGPGQLNYPYGIVASPTGYIYVSDQYNYRIAQFTAQGSFVRAWGSQGSGLGQFGTTIGLGADAQGRVYVADYGNSRVQVFTADGVFVRTWGGTGSDNGLFHGPRDVAVDASGLVHVVDEGNLRIQVFNPDGSFVTSWAGGTQGLSSLSFDPSGNAFVGTEAGVLSLWSPSHTLIRAWSAAGVVSGVAADATGGVYATVWNQDVVTQFGADGTLLRGWGTTGSGSGQFDHPADVAVDASGAIYVLDMYNHRVEKFQDLPAAPVIIAAQPAGGRIGDPVAILGANFTGLTALKFNGVDAVPTSVTDSRIDTTVPAGATTGPISATTPLGTGTSTFAFFVGETPIITDATPREGKVGTQVTIAGAHFTGTTRVAFGPGASSAAFTVDSDAQLTAVVDGQASTGPISVTTPAATGTSAFDFTFIPFDTAGRIVSVKDVPRDEGGKVVVKWTRSDFDRLGGFVTGYRLWRRAPVTMAAAAARAAGWWARASQAGTIDYWEPLSLIPAARLDGYASVAPTTEDSTEEANPYTAFFVQTLTNDPAVFYLSAVDSGYSIDNRGPSRPPRFTATYTPRGAVLHWDGNEEADLRGYVLHRGMRADFLPDTSNVIYAGPDTTFTDSTATNRYYLLAAEDVHGNLSRYALVTPQGPLVGIALMLEALASADRVVLKWYVIGQPAAQVFVERRVPGGAWQRIADLVADGFGNVSYTDLSVTPGQRLAYRMGLIDGDVELFSNEQWVDVPEARLALLAMAPNPLVGGRMLSLSFLVPEGGNVTLRILDVSGRVVFQRDLGYLTAGRHDRVLVRWTAAATGVYLARLEQGSRSVTSKLVAFH